MTDACETNAAIAPAIQNAGSRQSTTCSRAYHLVSSRASLTAPSKRGVPTGRKYTAANTAARSPKIFSSCRVSGLSVRVVMPTPQAQQATRFVGLPTHAPSRQLDEVRDASEFEAIENLLAALVAGDHARFTQHIEVLRGGGPAEATGLDEIADAALASDEGAYQSQACWAAQRLEDGVRRGWTAFGGMTKIVFRHMAK